MRKTITLLLLLSLIIPSGCEKDTDPEEEPVAEEPKEEGEANIEQHLMVESADVKTYEIVRIQSDLKNLQQTYSGTLGGSSIQLGKVNDSTLAFIIPNVESGGYELKTELGNIHFNVSQTFLSNAEKITDVLKTFDANIAVVEEGEQDKAKEFKNEVAALFNSLTTAQQIEVALYYEANKGLFDKVISDIKSTYDASTVLTRNLQSNCPKNDFKSFYSCTASNLGNSMETIGKSLLKLAEPLALAGAVGILAAKTWALGPAVWGLTAVGAGITLGTALYILITEVRPAFARFKTHLIPFLQANWILAQGTFAAIKEEFNGGIETDLNLNANFRSIEEQDTDISPETNMFINTYKKLSNTWDEYSKLFGSRPDYVESKEAFELEEGDIIISNISNPNVELIDLSGENVVFKTLSGNEETFTYDITVKKEGFIYTSTFLGTVKELPFDYRGTWIRRLYHHEDGSIVQDVRVTFNASGESVAGESEYITYTNNNGWLPLPSDGSHELIYESGVLIFKSKNNNGSHSDLFEVKSVDDKVFNEMNGGYLKLLRQ